jgi:hypothetical protein
LQIAWFKIFRFQIFEFRAFEFQAFMFRGLGFRAVSFRPDGVRRRSFRLWEKRMGVRKALCVSQFGYREFLRFSLGRFRDGVPESRPGSRFVRCT